MRNNFDIEDIAIALAMRFDAVTTKTLELIADRVKRIGTLSPSDAHAIRRLRDVGGDIEEIKRYLAKATQKSYTDIDRMFSSFAQNNYNFMRDYYDASGVTQIPFEQNMAIQRIIRTEAEITKNQFKNLSNTTAFALKDSKGKIQYVDIEQAYKNVIDKAITAVQSGVTDYHSEMRGVLKEMARSEVRQVVYDSGYSRDIFSATKMNMMDGIRQVSMGVREQCGREFGADGFEISVHDLCAPDHIDIQGRQYSITEYRDLNNTLQRPIGTLNCRHFATPILVGIKSVYTEEQLQDIKNRNATKSVKIGNRSYTPYEASQLMRQTESRIRKKKHEIETLKSAGDAEGLKKARNDLRVLQKRYTDISVASGIKKNYNNTVV